MASAVANTPVSDYSEADLEAGKPTAAATSNGGSAASHASNPVDDMKVESKPLANEPCHKPVHSLMHGVALCRCAHCCVVVVVAQQLLTLKEGFLPLMMRVQQHLPPLPDVHIEFENLSYAVEVPVHDSGVPTILSTLTSLPQPKKTQTFHVLNNVSGYLKPKSMTLVWTTGGVCVCVDVKESALTLCLSRSSPLQILAPPGHGKSALMRALSGRIPFNKLAGKVSASIKVETVKSQWSSPDHGLPFPHLPQIWYGARAPDEVNVRRIGTKCPSPSLSLALPLSVTNSDLPPPLLCQYCSGLRRPERRALAPHDCEGDV